MTGAPLALVTGGHRRLGARIAEGLARAGYAVAIHGAHDAAPDAALAGTLTATGAEWAGFVADFAEPGAATRLFVTVTAHFDRAPMLLVNSASLFGQDRIDSVTEADLAAHAAINAGAPAMLTRAFAAAWSAVAPGEADPAIVNMLDQRLAHPHRDQLAYTLSKGALATLTQASARALAPHVRVNAVAPGLTLATEDYDAGQLARLADMMPLGRLPEPEAVAEAVLYFARARAVTGQFLCVDGGAAMVAWDRDFMALGGD